MNATTTATKFEAGTTYYDRSACNWDCIYRVTVVRRTAKSVWITESHGDREPKRRAIVDYGDGIERFYPFGRYSMASVMRADRTVAELDD